MSALFSQTCEYAIRAAVEIARRPRDEFVLAREIAEKLSLPHQYLSKILQQLVRSRVLESTRGRQGGFRLTRDPDEVMLVEVVTPFEDLKKTEDCILGNAVCSDSRACPLHEFWKGVRANYLDELNLRSLGDFARAEGRVAKASSRKTKAKA
jgi:Rrf2 family protein